MKNLFLILIISFISRSVLADIVNNGNFSSGAAGWGCSPEINTQGVYSGVPNSNNVAEIDMAASLCQNLTGLTVGVSYSITFQCSRRFGSCPSPNPTNIRMTLSGGVLDVIISRSNTSFDLTTSSYTFIANSSSHTLNIVAGSGFGSSTCGMIIDQIAVAQSIALPIEITAFEAVKEGQQNFIFWQTSSERDNDYFTLERSQNATVFTFLAEIKGAGNSTKLLDYQKHDEYPYQGVTYYRLKQTDYNGVSTYSSIVALTNNLDNISINDAYPNPTISNITFEFICPVKGNLNMILYDSSGKIVCNRIKSMEDGSTIIEFDLENVAKGIYTLELEFDELNFKKVQKVIKN